MPRQTKDSTPQLAVKNLPPALPNVPISPSIELLRRDWRWASISQFLFTFGQAAGLSTWDIDLFEADLDSPDEDVLTPDTVTKFLYILTYDKTVKRQNLEVKLREQYLERSPKRNPFGTDTHPRLWGELGLGQKIDALYRVCEWQWSNPQRFRALLNDDEPTAWRVEPIGWDKEENCYWLFDDNRLWVQHPAPKPPKPPPKPKGASKKAKQAAARAKSKAQASSRPKPAPKPKPVTDDEMVEDDQPESSTRTRSRRNNSGRAASPSLDVIQKLIAEEKGLRSTRKRTRDQMSSERAREELNSTLSKRLRDRAGRAAPSAFTTPSKPSASTGSPLASGRSTRRTRATMAEDEIWQPIPDEWLTPSKTRASKAASGTIKGGGKQRPNGKGKGEETPKRKTGLESDTDDSELSELSDDDQAEVESPSKDQARGPASSELSVEPEELMMADGDDAQASRKSTPLSEAEERTPGPPLSNGGQGINGMEQDSTTAEAEPETVHLEADPETVSEPVADVEMPVAPIPDTPTVDEKMDVVEESSPTADEQSKGPAEVEAESHAEAGLDAVVDNIPAGLDPASADTADRTVEADAPPESPKIVQQPVEDAKLAEEAPGADVAEGKPLETETPQADVLDGAISQDAAKVAEPSAIKEEEEEEEDPDDEVLLAAKKALNPGFLEWECVCATRWDWENWPEQFAGSRHPDEKAFYAHIAENTRPAVLVFLREKEIQRAKEEAVRNRKRSSRIAMRELEKEEAARMEEVRRDLETRMQKVRDDEARDAAVEADKLAKEKEREDRLKDREERLKQREDAIAQRAIEEIRAKEAAEKAREFRAQKRLAGESAAASSASTPTGKAGKGKSSAAKAEQSEEEEEEWELACEVCKQHGWNVDDGRNIACCESCGRWQHTDCHDEHDDRLGRPRRDWDKVDFYCADCRKRIARERNPDGNKAQRPQTSPGHASAEPSTPKIRFSVPNAAQLAQGSPTSGRSKPQSAPRANGKASTASAPKKAASVQQTKASKPPSEKKAPRLPKTPNSSRTGTDTANARSTNMAQGSGEQYPSANGSSNGRPQAIHPNGSAYHIHAAGHIPPPGQYASGFPAHPQNGFAHAGPPGHHAQGLPVMMMQGPPAQSMPPLAATGPAPQLYLQSGQPVYRTQIQPMYAAQGQPVYRPSPSPQLASTPSRSQASQSPAQYHQHAGSPHRPQDEQNRPQVMYPVPPPSTQYNQPVYRPQVQPHPGHHYAQHPNASASGPMPYAQMGVPRQPVYAQQQVETQRYMQQQPMPDGFAYRGPAQAPPYAPSQPPPPSSR